MSIPLPPIVFGPITPITPEVLVGGVLQDAKVTVLAFHNSTQTTLGGATAKIPGDIWVALSKKPKPGWNVVAIQELGAYKSEPSPQPVVVVDTPKDLAAPAIVSELNTCMADVLADGLTPGATIVAKIGGASLATTPVSRTLQWIGLNQTSAIPVRSVMEIHQEASVGGQILQSPIAKTLPIASLKLENLPPPVFVPPLEGCGTDIDVARVTPGAILKIDNGGMSESTVSPWANFKAHGMPLTEGPLVASQRMPRCNLVSKDANYTVTPPSWPPTPLVQQTICPKVACFVASHLIPGATLNVTRCVRVSANVSSSQFGSSRKFGIGHETETIYLGSEGMELTDPQGPVFFTVSQTLCGVVGKFTEVSIAVAGGPFGPPKIVEPVYGCSRAVRVSGAHAGAWVQAFDSPSKMPISDLVVAPAQDFLLKLWFPAVPGANILLRQIGCNADGASQAVAVKKIPGRLPTPVIKEPVRPGTNAVQLSGALPGARVFILVDGVVRTQSDCWTDTPTFYLAGALLAENQKLFAMQSMCDQWSPNEGPSVAVAKGKMNLVLSITSIPRGTPSSITVDASDADTHAPIPLGQVFIKGQLVGTTGQAFSFTPASTEPSPLNGEVHEDVGHYPASFQIALIDPYSAVHNVAAPTKFYVDGTLEVTVEEATWILTPDWDLNLKKTVVSAATPPNIHIDTQIPAPTGGVKTMKVQLERFKCSTPGGSVNNTDVEPSTFLGFGDTVTIGYAGKQTKVSWLILFETRRDQSGRFSIKPQARVTDITDY